MKISLHNESIKTNKSDESPTSLVKAEFDE
jgi:hypothetical protein